MKLHLHLPNLARDVSHPLSLPLVILLCPERPLLGASPLPKDGHGSQEGEDIISLTAETPFLLSLSSHCSQDTLPLFI